MMSFRRSAVDPCLSICSQRSSGTRFFNLRLVGGRFLQPFSILTCVPGQKTLHDVVESLRLT